MLSKMLLRSILQGFLVTAALATLTIGITQNAQAQGGCSRYCCWHWFWGYQSICSIPCGDGGTCSCTCSCAECSCSCTQGGGGGTPMEPEDPGST